MCVTAFGGDQLYANNQWAAPCMANSDDQFKTDRVMGRTRTLFFLCLVVSFVVSALWLYIIKACSTIIVRVFFYSIIGSLLLGAAAVYSMAKSIEMAAPPVVLALLIGFWYFRYGAKRLGFVGENLAVAITIIQSYPRTVVCVGRR